MIRDFKAGDEVIEFFVLRRKEIKAKRDGGEAYLSVELADASGRILGSMWENFKQPFETLERGDVVKVKGRVIDFHERPHLHIDKIRKAADKDRVDLSKLVPVVEKERDKLLQRVKELIESVGNPFLRRLLDAVFGDPAIRKGFYHAPGGKLWHHNYLGGLMEHTLTVTEICLSVAALYDRVDRDLLLAGGLLHDIGKIQTYHYRTVIEFTDRGRLLGHIVLGAQLVTEKIQTIDGFPNELRDRLLHLILSHQGKLEQASPVVPMTLEGLILYYADELDSKANAFLRIRKKEAAFGKWSSYVKLLERYFYFGEPRED